MLFLIRLSSPILNLTVVKDQFDHGQNFAAKLCMISIYCFHTQCTVPVYQAVIKERKLSVLYIIFNTFSSSLNNSNQQPYQKKFL